MHLKGDQIMYRLEVIRDGKNVVTEYCRELAHLRGVMAYYISMRPDQKYRLYNDINGKLIDEWM